MLYEHQRPADRGQIEAMHFQYAEAHVLGDMDTFTDWLGSLCIGQRADSERMLRWIDRAPTEKTADVPTLLHALLSCDAEVFEKVRGELVRRYLAEHQDYVLRKAADYAGEPIPTPETRDSSWGEFQEAQR